jgi:predicted secreted Zn-dependent protease
MSAKGTVTGVKLDRTGAKNIMSHNISYYSIGAKVRI